MHRRRVVRFLVALVALSFFAASCGDDGGAEESDDPPTDDTSTSTTASTTTATIPGGGEAVAGISLTEVTFGNDGFVRITNDSDADLSLDGLWLCNRPTYVALSGTVTAGGSVEIAASGLGGLSASGGEAALYTVRDFSNSDEIIDYVQWGTGGGRESVAVGAGLWPEGGTVTPDPDFGSIERFDVAGGPEAWE